MLFYLNPQMDATAAAKCNSEELFQTLWEFAVMVKTVAQAKKEEQETAAQAAKQLQIRERQQAARAKAAAEKAAAAAAQ